MTNPDQVPLEETDANESRPNHPLDRYPLDLKPLISRPFLKRKWKGMAWVIGQKAASRRLVEVHMNGALDASP
jgi:hypothetical protein